MNLKFVWILSHVQSLFGDFFTDLILMQIISFVMIVNCWLIALETFFYIFDIPYDVSSILKFLKEYKIHNRSYQV